MFKIIAEAQTSSRLQLKTMLMRTAFGGALSLCLTTAALAQNVNQPVGTNTQEADETVLIAENTEQDVVDSSDDDAVVSTGSRIRNTNTTLNSITFDTEDIKRSGALTLDDFLRQIPQNQTRLDPGVADFGGTGASGTFSDRSGGVNLRGLGEQNTLILVDGRRIATSSSRPRDGAGGVRSVGVTPDIEGIPLQAIERIEIITDGASALYGSDAIGGVVNIILKKDFEGGSVTARYGNSSADADDFSIQGTYGFNRGKFRSLFTAGYTREKSVRVRNASFVRPAEDFEAVGLIPPPSSAFGFPAIAQISTDICADGAGGEEQCDPLDPFSFFDAIRLGSLNIPGDGFQTVFASFPGDLGRFPNVSDVELESLADPSLFPEALGPDSEAFTASASFNYDVSDNTELRANVLYSRRESEGAFTPFGFNFALDATHPFNPFTIANGAQFDESITALFSSAILAQEGLVPFQEFSDTTENYTLGIGANQKIGWNDWEVRLDYSYSRSQGNGQSLEADPAAEAGFVGTAEFQTLNVFGPDGPDAALINGLIREAPRSSNNDLHTVNLVADGKLLELPGGDLRLAVGGEYRNEAFNFVNDAREDPNTGELNTPFCLTTAFACPFVESNFDFGRDVWGGFVEANVPIIGESMNIPFVQDFTVSASTRYDRFEDGDVRDRFSSSIGAIWRVNDALSFRGNWNESFRAPDIIQLSDPVSVTQNGFVFDDPLSPFTIVLTEISGGNAELDDETAETFSFGGQLNFDIGQTSFFFNANYFNNTIRNQTTGNFSTNTRQAILGNPELFPEIIQRDINNPGVIDSFTQVPFNAVSTKSTGADFSGRIAHELNNGHVIAAQFNGTTNFKFETQELEIIEAVDTVGRSDGPQDFSGNLNLRYSTDNLIAGVTARYNSSYEYEAFNRNEFTFTDFTADDYLTFDVQVTYDFGSRDGLLNGTRVGIIGTNIFEAEPPLFGLSPFGVGFFNGVDPRQRVLAFEVSKQF